MKTTEKMHVYPQLESITPISILTVKATFHLFHDPWE